MRLYLDTNVLMDLVYSRDPFYIEAQAIFELKRLRKVELLLSAVSFITTFYYCKKYHYNEDAVRNSLTRIESMVDIPDIGKSNIHDALQSGIKDFEDATQIFCAYAGEADIIITRNKKDFAESSIPVKTPFEFLSEHEDWF